MRYCYCVANVAGTNTITVNHLLCGCCIVLLVALTEQLALLDASLTRLIVFDIVWLDVVYDV